jgi:hypothetical protein
MRDFERMATDQLWLAIIGNAQQARHTTNWVELLDNIKVLCALIDERIEVFQRRGRADQLLSQHRNSRKSGPSGMLKSRGGEKDEV